ncbi:group III truncated hemoglobin [Luteimonas sp. Y-2-2-4F]|nr:group III truncated hemoglobin [Luteimonas sp. Y-2-2-4F]MCD9033848.1 group III truncated hemoglobin [Luteimonas sp. Y-2-2-4F]
MPSTPPPFPAPCCTEEEIVALVHRFYARVRRDPDLGPMFERHIDDWDAHLAQLVDFWSTMLLGTRRFNGAPMPRHMALPGLTPARFERWLALFGETTAELGNPALEAEADARAAQIADRFWQRYRIEGHDALRGGPAAR